MRLAGCIIIWLLTAACGEKAARVCEDPDGDGYGPGCAFGSDCDEADPARNSDCSDAGAIPEDCDVAPSTAGCPCLSGERTECFTGGTEHADVGRCKVGRISCENGRWPACDAQVLPEVERCDGEDDDCDGLTDEGVESPCGGCNSECQGGVWGSAAAPFEAAEPLSLTAAGELTLAWQPFAAKTLWVANTDEGSVSKVDTASAREVARYRTRGGYPIQVAVDHRGDVFVLDGAFGGEPRLTKIAGARERCRGTRTSSGAEMVLPVGEDECVLLDLPLTAADDPRTLAVDGALSPDGARAGDVWLSFDGTAQLAQLSGDSGAELARYELRRYDPQLQPSASAFDLYGGLWLIARDGMVLRFDPLDPEAGKTMLVPFACYTLDSLSLDAGGKLLLSGFGCERVFSYEPQRGQWRSAQMPDLLTPRGVIAGTDASWVSYNSGAIAALARDTLQPMAASPLSSDALKPFETFALSRDADGMIWAVSTQGGPRGVGVATRFDPMQQRVTAQVPLGRGPRAGGDLSGSASGGEFARAGRASHVFAGCGRETGASDAVSQSATEWLNLRLTTLLGAGASVRVLVRHAESVEALQDATFEALGELPRDAPPFPLQLPAGGVIEVAIELASPYAIGAPRVGRVGVEWTCPGPE